MHIFISYVMRRTEAYHRSAVSFVLYKFDATVTRQKVIYSVSCNGWNN